MTGRARSRRVGLAAAALAALTTACEPPLGGEDGDGGVSCGSETCTAAQVCAYRECTDKERCQVRRQCPPGATPTVCDGQPGCLLAECGPVVQGCRDIPASCDGGVSCACNEICGGSDSCAKVDGRNVDCASP